MLTAATEALRFAAFVIFSWHPGGREQPRGSLPRGSLARGWTPQGRPTEAARGPFQDISRESSQPRPAPLETVRLNLYGSAHHQNYFPICRSITPSTSEPCINCR